MAALNLSWATDYSEYAEKQYCCTGADGLAGCEDMPRKSIDIKFTDYPVQQKRGNCALFLPSGEDGFGQRPKMGQGTGSLWVLRATP